MTRFRKTDPRLQGSSSLRQTFLVLTGSTAGCVSSPAHIRLASRHSAGPGVGITWKGSMRRPGIGLFILVAFLSGNAARSAPLPPSADPVAAFVAAADSAYHSGSDAALSAFV